MQPDRAPTQEEIDRVNRWHEQQRRARYDDELSEVYRATLRDDKGVYYKGVLLDRTFSHEALLGALVKMENIAVSVLPAEMCRPRPRPRA